MKPCVCGGSNENCRYCGGEGYVPDDKGLPHPPSDLETWLPESNTLPPVPEKRPFLDAPPSSSPLKDLKGCLLGMLLNVIVVTVLVFLGLLWKSC